MPHQCVGGSVWRGQVGRAELGEWSLARLKIMLFLRYLCGGGVNPIPSIGGVR